MSNTGSLSTFMQKPCGDSTHRVRPQHSYAETHETDHISQLPKPSIESFLKPIKSPQVKLPEVPHKPKLPYLELTKKQHKLKLNTSHQMIRAMVSLEDEQEALKDKSNFAKSFKRMTAGMKIIEGLSSEKALDSIAENVRVFDEKNLREVVPSIKRPDVSWSNNSTSMWMKKRGFEGNSTGTIRFTQFLKNFFKVLDENSNGFISPNEIIIPLLSLGLSNKAQYIENALLNMFNVGNVNDIQMSQENFLSLFKGDKKNDIILAKLDEYCKEMLREEEEKKYAQIAAQRRHTSFMAQNTMVSEKNPEKRYPTIEEFIKLVLKWWKDLSNDSASVNISRIAEFLAEKGMAANKHEGRIIAKNSDSSSAFPYFSFEKIFLKAILKASLFNVAVFLNMGDSEDFSMKLKLVIVQRRLMMAGTKTRRDANSKQGRVTLHALDSYKKKVGDKFTKETSNLMTIEAAEEINEDKMLQMLFKLKESAVSFLEDNGDVKKNVKNIWDIKLNVGDDDDCSPTPKFKEERYLSALKNPEIFLNGTGPYSRKIKMFRENFLLKKFNKMIDQYPELKKGK